MFNFISARQASHSISTLSIQWRYNYVLHESPTVHVLSQLIEAAPSESVVEKPTRLAIGVEGGFDGGGEKLKTEETLSLVAMPELTSVPWPCDQLPLQVCSEAIISLGPGCTRGLAHTRLMWWCLAGFGWWCAGAGVSQGNFISSCSKQAGCCCSLGWREESRIHVILFP